MRVRHCTTYLGAFTSGAPIFAPLAPLAAPLKNASGASGSQLSRAFNKRLRELPEPRAWQGSSGFTGCPSEAQNGWRLKPRDGKMLILAACVLHLWDRARRSVLTLKRLFVKRWIRTLGQVLASLSTPKSKSPLSLQAVSAPVGFVCFGGPSLTARWRAARSCLHSC